MIRKRLSTVRVQTTIAATLALALALLLAVAIIIYAQRTDLKHNIQTTARLRADDIAASLASGDLITPIASQPGDAVVAQVVDSNGNVIASSANLTGQPAISHLSPHAGAYASQEVESLPAGKEGDFVIVAKGTQHANASYTIFVASSLEAVTDSTVTLIGLFAVIIPMLVIVVGITAWIITGRALRPVDEMRRQVEEIELLDLHRRITEPAAHDEIGQLAKTMNAMLDRLQQSSERQQRFVADASHELRSPLTAIRSRLEVDLAYSDGTDWRSTEQDVLEDALRLQRLVDDLLTLARFDDPNTQSSTRVAIDLDEIVLQQTRQLHEQTTHHVDTSAVSGAQILGNADQLTRVVRNLLDNADRHANSRVIVALHESDNEVVLSIADDGPGIPTASQDEIFERFTRLDDARARDTGGSGLGLAITKEIVLAHHGAITVGDSSQGGACFTLTFPVPRS